MKNTDLPIYELRAPLLQAAQTHRRLVIQAPTGSGKSTQVPQILLDAGLLGDGRAVVLQPRRLPTRLLAARVAQERGGRLGDEVGYQIRFDNVSSPHTRIKYETEGILLRQLMLDPELRGVSAILFDEFHERHLYGDIMLARAMELQATLRPDLLIVVMSATLDTAPLETYLAPCSVLRSEGRMYPVNVEYIPRPLHPERDTIMDAAVHELEQRIADGVPGDVLIFMPGAYEIRRTIQLLQGSSAARSCVVLPLHGELPPGEQDAAVAGYGQRKIVVSTNVAETSLTIDGVRLVIDSGMARIPRYDPNRGINTLLIEHISRAAADQRAGRAGRTAPGVCVRLWTEQEQRGRALHELPEIRRVDIAEAILNLKAAGVGDLRTFRWFEAPDEKGLARAETMLTDLGALDATSRAITDIGLRMATFPMHPRYARMLLAAEQYGCVRQAALVAALTQGRSLLVRQTGRDTRSAKDDLFGDDAASDFIVLMRAWRYAVKNRYDLNACRRVGVHAQAARLVQPVFDYFLRMAKQQGLDTERPAADDEALCKAVLAGFADQVAIRRDIGTLRCRVVHGRSGILSRESCVQKAPLFTASEIQEIEARDEVQVRLNLATAIKEEWLNELFPGSVTEQVQAVYDPTVKRVVAERVRCYRDLPLESHRAGDPPAEQAAEILAEECLKGKLELPKWDDAVEQWITRLNALAEWCPDLGLPTLGEAERRLILQDLCHGHYSHKEIRVLPVLPVVKRFLSGAQQGLLDRYAPMQLNIGAKRVLRLVYVPQGPPALSARIQDLFGVKQIPTVAMGRIQPVLKILAPNQRPVQITHDLPSFWQDHYPRIRQELKRKYPKHAWPENPV